MLPSTTEVPASTLKLLRPDLLIIDGLETHQVPDLRQFLRDTQDAEERKQALGKFSVHVIELSYVCETQAALVSKHIKKQAQHATLISHPTRAGWKVHNDEITVIAIGNTGTIFHPLGKTLCELGVGPSSAVSTMNAIHVLSVRHAHAMITARCLHYRSKHPAQCTPLMAPKLSPKFIISAR